MQPIPDIIKALMLAVLKSGGVALRDVDGGEKPFLYSSGNYGPIYVDMKGRVGFEFFRALCAHLAYKLAYLTPNIGFIAGNATGGMVPARDVQQTLNMLLGRHVPYVYVRGTRKAGGHQELITGLDALKPEMEGVVIEELVNFGQTTVNSTELLRGLGYTMEHAGCILNYDTAPNRAAMTEHHVQLTHLFTLAELMTVAEEEGVFSRDLMRQYRSFSVNPALWMMDQGLVREEKGGTQ